MFWLILLYNCLEKQEFETMKLLVEDLIYVLLNESQLSFQVKKTMINEINSMHYLFGLLIY